MTRIVTIAAVGLAAGLCLSLGGCATGERMTADGKLEHQLYCGGLLPWSVCDSKAAETCPTGYTVTERSWTPSEGSFQYIRCNSTPAAVAGN